jgi:AraC-like DNA-binding protein
MKAVFEKIDLQEGQSLVIRGLDLPEFDAPWHFHPELELTFIRKSRGTRFVGNSIEEFAENDLVLLGPNLPHFWQNPATQTGRSEAVVIHFSEGFLNNSIFLAPEFISIRQLIEKSKNGVLFPATIAQQVGEKMTAMLTMDPFQRVVGLMEILQTLAGCQQTRTLASVGYTHFTTPKDAEKMAIVFEYVRQHFRQVIRLEAVASLLHQTPQAFCRYFKKRAKKTFFDFVNEFRIGHASRLLIDSELSITEICLQSGYTTIPHFNKQFKRITGLSPTGFRKKHFS